jgi:hypothetical protein
MRLESVRCICIPRRFTGWLSPPFLTSTFLRLTQKKEYQNTTRTDARRKGPPMAGFCELAAGLPASLSGILAAK